MLETVAQSLLQALLHNDVDAISRLVAEDVVFETIGRNPIAGIHYGRDDVSALSARMHAHRQRFPYREQVSETITHGDAVIMLVQAATERDGQKRNWNFVQVFHFRGNQVDRGMMYLDDQYAFDEYWAA
jgi:uncharacterized protein